MPTQMKRCPVCGNMFYPTRQRKWCSSTCSATGRKEWHREHYKQTYVPAPCPRKRQEINPHPMAQWFRKHICLYQLEDMSAEEIADMTGRPLDVINEVLSDEFAMMQARSMIERRGASNLMIKRELV